MHEGLYNASPRHLEMIGAVATERGEKVPETLLFDPVVTRLGPRAGLIGTKMLPGLNFIGASIDTAVLATMDQHPERHTKLTRDLARWSLGFSLGAFYTSWKPPVSMVLELGATVLGVARDFTELEHRLDEPSSTFHKRRDTAHEQQRFLTRYGFDSQGPTGQQGECHPG
jgi:hypothetical protein